MKFPAKATRLVICKAKDLYTKEWVQGYIVPIDGEKGEKFAMIVLNEDGSTEKHQILQDTICAYTGLLDASNHRIFEHDKVSRMNKRDDIFFPSIEEVTYSRTYASWMAKTFITKNRVKTEPIRIKGNIFDDVEEDTI